MSNELSERIRDLQYSLGRQEGDLTPSYANELADEVTAIEARLSKMEGLDVRISDGDVWLHFPDVAISIDGICRFVSLGPIVKKNLRAWRDKALAGERDE